MYQKPFVPPGHIIIIIIICTFLYRRKVVTSEADIRDTKGRQGKGGMRRENSREGGEGKIGK